MIENIWFVDDDEDDCELFETVINSVLPSAAITYIHNGEVFMDSLKFTNQPDLIFLDINMPCRTGFDCLSEIGLIPNSATSPSLFLVVQTSRSKFQQLMKRGLIFILPSLPLIMKWKRALPRY
jgi:CheY-like chemotaxis protein